MCLRASVLHQQEDASSIPTTPNQINNPPPLDTSESPCLQMLCLPCIYPQGLLLPHPLPLPLLPSITTPQPGGEQHYLHTISTCTYCTHTHTGQGMHVAVMDGLPLSVMHKSIIRHLPAQRKEMLF